MNAAAAYIRASGQRRERKGTNARHNYQPFSSLGAGSEQRPEWIVWTIIFTRVRRKTEAEDLLLESVSEMGGPAAGQSTERTTQVKKTTPSNYGSGTHIPGQFCPQSQPFRTATGSIWRCTHV
jgi:hypothetical protein